MATRSICMDNDILAVGSAVEPDDLSDDLSKEKEGDHAENITNESTNSNPEISTESTNDLSLPPPTPETFQHKQSSESLSHKAETKNNDSVMLKIKTGGSSVSDVESKDPKSSNIQKSTQFPGSKIVTDSIPSLVVNAVDTLSPNDNCLTSNSELLKNDPKYTYAEEQWSPLGPEGKKLYDRSFLLQCINSNLSVVKPAGLPALDLILREPRVVKQDLSSQPGGDQTPPVDFTPGLVIPSMPGGRGPSRGGRPARAVKKQNSVQSQQRKVNDIISSQDITLHTAVKAWKPGKTDDLDENEIIYKKLRSILNKLTPQKFQTLIQQVRTLPIDTQERLTGCINILFETAINEREPNFSVAYANMAKCLISLNVPSEDDPTVPISFRKLLLTKCQIEFEKDKIDELDIAKIQQLIDAASTEESKKRLLVEEKNDLMGRANRRSLGNIRFIGELFKLKMLTEKIMHECLKKLLKSDDDEHSLECLCQLLTIIGSDIDQNRSKLIVNKYFAELERIVALKNTSHRIRFKIQDVIDLRKNDWVPRRDKNNPKTIEQIHRIQPSGRNAASTTPIGGAGLLNDGWMAANRPPKVVVDPSKMRFTKQIQVDDNIQRGPGGRGMSVWHRGSSGGSDMEAPHQNDSKGGLTPNRFSELGSRSGSEYMDARNMAPRAGGGRDREYRGRMTGPHTTRGQKSRPSQNRRKTSFRSGLSDTSELPDVRSASHEVSRLVTCHNHDQHQLNFCKLEFNEPQTSGSAAPPNLYADKIRDNLVKLFAEIYIEVDDVLDWLNEIADESMRRSSAFIRALMTSLCISCTLKQKENIYTVDQPRFKKFIPVLKNFTAHKADTQLEALFALQGLVHRLEHPTDLLRTFFEILYDEEAVEDDVFRKWKNSEDNIELGKGVALQSVVQFFNWLENDEES